MRGLGKPFRTSSFLTPFPNLKSTHNSQSDQKERKSQQSIRKICSFRLIILIQGHNLRKTLRSHPTPRKPGPQTLASQAVQTLWEEIARACTLCAPAQDIPVQMKEFGPLKRNSEKGQLRDEHDMLVKGMTSMRVRCNTAETLPEQGSFAMCRNPIGCPCVAAAAGNAVVLGRRQKALAKGPKHQCQVFCGSQMICLGLLVEIGRSHK